MRQPYKGPSSFLFLFSFSSSPSSPLSPFFLYSPSLFRQASLRPRSVCKARCILAGTRRHCSAVTDIHDLSEDRRVLSFGTKRNTAALGDSAQPPPIHALGIKFMHGLWTSETTCSNDAFSAVFGFFSTKLESSASLLIQVSKPPSGSCQ